MKRRALFTSAGAALLAWALPWHRAPTARVSASPLVRAVFRRAANWDYLRAGQALALAASDLGVHPGAGGVCIATVCPFDDDRKITDFARWLEERER